MREIRTRETDTEYARLWTLAERDRVLFVTHLTPDSATRYQFTIENEDTGRVTITQSDGTTPPRVVVELLSEAGFTVDNLPNIDATDPAVQADTLIDAIQWLSEHGGFEPGGLRASAYHRSQNALTVVTGSHIILEVIGPDRYRALLDEVLATASYEGHQLTRDDLLKPRSTDIEFLQNVLVSIRRVLSAAEQEHTRELYIERGGNPPPQTTEADGLTTMQQSTSNEEFTIQLPPEAVDQLTKDGWMDAEDPFR